MRKPTTKPVATALGAAIAGLALSGSAFAMQPLAQGYMLGATATADGHAAGEGKCGEGKCGKDGKCDMASVDTDGDGQVSRAEFAAAHAGMEARFAGIDTDGSGFISAAEMEAHHATMKDGHDAHPGAAAKAPMEGKCGEGKCGGGI